MKKILCENDLCIYQKNKYCSLRFISISEVGMCTDCIQIRLDSSELEYRKRTTLKRLEKDENSFMNHKMGN